MNSYYLKMEFKILRSVIAVKNFQRRKFLKNITPNKWTLSCPQATSAGKRREHASGSMSNWVSIVGIKKTPVFVFFFLTKNYENMFD